MNLDTLQELVNALKNNVSSINDLFTELAKKVNITDYNAKITSIEIQINTLSSNTYTKTEIDEKLGLYALNNELNNKLLDYYNKLEVETLIDSKINTALDDILSKEY